jgi:hypothetical protein
VSEQVTVSASGGGAADRPLRHAREIVQDGGGTAAAELPQLPEHDQPGARRHAAAFQNSMGASPQRSLTTNVNGTNRNNNNTRVDGAINVYIWLPHHTLYNPPVESIETVNISTSSFDAEQGMAGGAAVTVATKSGTNELRGAAFWYHDNQHLYARPYFYRRTAKCPRCRNRSSTSRRHHRRPDRQEQAVLLLQLRADLRAHRPVRQLHHAAGRHAGRQFLRLRRLGQDLRPADRRCRNGAGRIPFANNQIPQSRFSPIWTKIQALAPLPNQPAQDASASPATTSPRHPGADARPVRHQDELQRQPTKLMIWGKYSHMNAPVRAPARSANSPARPRPARHRRRAGHHPHVRLQLHALAHLPGGRRLRPHPLLNEATGPGLRPQLGLGGLGHPRHQRRQRFANDIATRASRASTTASPPGATAPDRTRTSTTTAATPTRRTSRRCRARTNSAGAWTSCATP